MHVHVHIHVHVCIHACGIMMRERFTHQHVIMVRWLIIRDMSHDPGGWLPPYYTIVSLGCMHIISWCINEIQGRVPIENWFNCIISRGV